MSIVATGQLTLTDLNDIAGGGRNFLLNSAFLTGDFTNWVNWGTATRTVVDVTDLTGFTKAFKLVTTATNQGIYQTVGIMPNTTYTASFWAKVDTGSGYVQLAISDNLATPTLRYLSAGTTNTTVWTRFTYTFTTLADESTTLQFQVGRGAGGATGTYYFTGLKMELGDGVTDWSPAPEDIFTNLSEIEQKLSDMANDSLLTQAERGDVKDTILKITGVDQANTSNLPTSATLDASLKGEFYSIRKQAINAGITTSDTTYVAVSTEYSDLKTYLDALSPKPWDVSSTANTTIVSSTWRTTWNAYFTAYNNLAQAISAKLYTDIGGRNYMPNSSADIDNDSNGVPDGWSVFASVSGALTMDSGRITANSIKAVVTAINGGVSTPLATIDSQAGQTMTISGWMKADKAATLGWLLKFRDSSAVESNPITQVSKVVVADTWTYLEQTFTVPATAVTCYATPRVYASTGISATTPVTIWVDDMKLEEGNQATDWSSAPEDIVGQISIVETRISDAEIKIQPGNITSTVTNHTDFKFMMNGYATTTALGDKADQTSLDEAVSDLSQEIADQIAALPFDAYATTTYVDQQADSVTAKIESGGGINLIKNSVGWADYDNWYAWSSTRIKVVDVDYMGFGKGYEFVPTTASKTLLQDIDVIVGAPYTISWVINKRDTVGAVGVDDGAFWVQIQENAVTKASYKYGTTAVTNGWKKYSATSSYSDFLTYTPSSSKITIRLIGFLKSDVTITGLMLNVGVVPLQWTMATGEIYNTNIRMDLNGIRVESYDNGTAKSTTVMTPDKFAGYYDTNNDGVVDTSTGSVDEVFLMDGENFKMKNAVVTTSITMGSVKVTYLNSGGHTGWAFTPSN